MQINVTSFSVFHIEATVCIGLKNKFIIVTFILQNYMSMLEAERVKSLFHFIPTHAR